MTQGWNPTANQFPRPPSNVHITSSYIRGVFDVHWDTPQQQWANAQFQVLGVNIYRSDTSDRGPYFRLNQFPLGGAFYRDATEACPIQNELIENLTYRQNAPNDRSWIFRTKYPIIKRDLLLYGSHQSPTYANSAFDVSVSLNGEPIPVHSVFGKNGEITLINWSTYDSSTDRVDCPPLPINENDVLTVSYFTVGNFLQTGLDRKIFYRLTTVAQSEDGNLIETPLAYSEPHTNQEIEVIDYIWREAMRRNNWILEQGGERVKVFLRKRAGKECSCANHVHAKTKEFYKQPSNRCLVCFGTGFIGGYEGPFEMIIGPDDGERKVTQLPQGRQLEHTYQVWTGASPMLTQRDFIVRQNNERSSIGPITRPSNRGNILQQMFSIGYLDEQDIRYRVPIENPSLLPWPESRRTPVLSLAYIGRQPQSGYVAYNEKDGDMTPPYPEGEQNIYPQATNKENIPADRQLRGRTKVWENINY